MLKRAARTISTFLSTSVSEGLELAETDATGAGGMMLKIDAPVSGRWWCAGPSPSECGSGQDTNEEPHP
jgi:hypothetical protein